VHHPLLNLALWHCRNEVRDTPNTPNPTDSYDAQVEPRNCTTAKIFPETLLPRLTDSTPVPAKMVDFALALASPSLASLIARRRAISPNENWFINHTSYPPLRNGPIGVNIETKRTGEDYSEGVVKLQIWSAAQFRRIEEISAEAKLLSNPLDAERDASEEVARGKPEQAHLTFGGREDLWIPGIMIQGHEWRFVAAVRDGKTKATVSFPCISIPHQL
jgi:hypothetical protein